jgi:hypothetical protein
MKKLLISLGAVAMLASLGSVAQAAVIILPGPFSGGAVNTFGDITFDSGLTAGTVVNTPTFVESAANKAGAQSALGVTFSGDAYIVNNLGGPANGQSATPAGDNTNYMSVLAGGTETLHMSGLSQNFGLYWGSIDDYNTITFKNGAVTVATFTGADPLVAAAPSFGNQFANAQNKYLIFTGFLFTDVVLQSSQNSFEFDNVNFASAGRGGPPGTPEASTWAMMILGFLGVGFISYRRKTAKSSLRFA